MRTLNEMSVLQALTRGPSRGTDLLAFVRVRGEGAVWLSHIRLYRILDAMISDGLVVYKAAASGDDGKRRRGLFEVTHEGLETADSDRTVMADLFHLGRLR